jgi:hypothetical protein
MAIVGIMDITVTAAMLALAPVRGRRQAVVVEDCSPSVRSSARSSNGG